MAGRSVIPQAKFVAMLLHAKKNGWSKLQLARHMCTTTFCEQFGASPKISGNVETVQTYTAENSAIQAINNFYKSFANAFDLNDPKDRTTYDAAIEKITLPDGRETRKSIDFRGMALSLLEDPLPSREFTDSELEELTNPGQDAE